MKSNGMLMEFDGIGAAMKLFSLICAGLFIWSVWLVFLWGVMGRAPPNAPQREETSQANTPFNLSFLLFQ